MGESGSQHDVNNNSNKETKVQKSILIIEDDNVLKNMYSQRLQIEGYKTFGAMDGEEGLDIFNKENIDLVVTDIMLPRMSGTEFLQGLRKLKKGKNTPVIAWTNLEDAEVKQKAMSLGAKEFLRKGQMQLDDLVEIVKKYI